MRLKSFLIVAAAIERSRPFYHDPFGLEMILDHGGNMLLTDGRGRKLIRFHDPDGNLTEAGAPA